MAINKKLIHFEKRDNFDTRLANNEINDTSIVFIQDTGELWTHGLFFCTTATNLLEAPVLTTSGDTIAVQIGDKTSNYIVPPAALKGRTMYECVTDTANTRGHWTGTIPGVTELYDGLVIHVRFTTSYYGNGEGYNTLNINNLGHKLVWWRYGSILTTHWGSNAELTLTYRTTAGSYKVANAKGELTNGTTYTDGWVADYAYYTDGNYLVGSYYFRSKINANGYIGRYMLFMRCPDGTVTGLTTTNNSTATTKTMYSGPLLLGYVWYYGSTSTFAANANFYHDGSNIRDNYSLVDVRYTFNCGSTLVSYKPFFIVGSIGNDGYFYLDTTQPWSLEYPDTDNDKIYILLGYAYDTYRITFEVHKPMYIYKNGGIQLYSQYASETEWNNIIGKPSTFTPSAHDHDERYLLLAGGTMTGHLKWTDANALPLTSTANYFVTIDAFADGGTTKWISKANALTSLTGLNSSAKGSITTPIYWTGSAFSTVLATFGSQNYGEHNANNIKSNGLWYYTSNGPTKTLGASTTDGALYTQAYNNTWVAQIAQDYRNGNLFTRGLNNGTWTTWRKVWNDGNDGSGSGLDADLLDGKHAADFALSNHLYHKLTVNENYYESYSGENLFSIVTKNFRYDNLRFKSSTITDVQYWNYTTNEWQSWSKDLSPLFNGSGETNVSIPKENRKFRFCITSASGWPATAMFVLLGNYHNAGTITTLNGNYSNVIIETRNSDTEFVEKASFGFSTSFMGTNARVLSSLHTGDTIYRITIELASWTTENNAALKMIAIFSNYGNMPLQAFRHDGYGNIYPITSEKYSLGTSSYRWNGFYTTTASLSSTLSVAGALTFSGVPEGADNFSDGTELLTSVLGVYGFNTSGYVGKVYRRKALNMYNYLKGKFDTLYLGTSGNANTATEFASAQSITLTGDTTGTASSTAGWSIETTTKYLTGIIANSSASAPSAITTTPGTSKITYYSNVLGGTTGLYTTTNNANAILTLNRHTGSYDSQLGFSSNGNIYYRNFAGTALNTTQAWKQIAFTDSNITGQASYAANVGSAGTLGTNYVTAAKVIAACNWYDTVSGTDDDTVINRWSEIVNFVAGFEETPDLATYLANNYLAKTGNSTASPMTGTIYSQDVNALVVHSNNKNLDIWRVTGNSGTWDNSYGFYLRYNGVNLGNDNSLSLWANNQTGNDIEVYQVKLNGILNFLKAPTINGTAISLTTHDHDGTYLKLIGGTLTGAVDISTSSSATDTTKGINFTYSTTTGHIGLSTLLGIYSSGNIAIRPNGGSSAGLGLDISSTSFKYNNTNVSLEGHTHSEYITSVAVTDDTTNHADQLRYVKNGVSTYFTVPYATNTDTVDGYHETSFFRSRGLIATSYVDLTTYTANAEGYINPQNGIWSVPRSGYSEGLITFTGSGSTTGLDLYFHYLKGKFLKFRRRIDSNRVSGAWETFITDLNYTTYCATKSHNHNDLYVTSVGVTDDTTNHANLLRYVKNGTSTYFTVPFATSSTNATNATTAANLNKSTLGYLYQSATTTTGSTGTVTATSGKIGVPIQFYGSQVNYALNNDLFYATVASNAITANTIYLGDDIKSKTFVKTSTHVPTGASSGSSSSGTSGESITYTAGNGIKIAGTLISTNTWTGTESLFAELANPSSYDLIYIIED